MEPQEWSIETSVATEGSKIPAETAEDLLDVLTDLGGLGVVVSSDSVRLSARFNVAADGIIDAVTEAERLMLDSLEKVGLSGGRVERFEIETLEHQEREFAREPEGYAGVSEIAQLLDVSKQRVSELRRLPGFPAPVAELAAGPVWHRSMLQRFIDTWERKPGRPRKDAGALPLHEGR
jgi:hypothetical protein